MFYAIGLMSDLKPGDRGISRIHLGSAALLCFIAVLVTAIWAGILYGVSSLFGWTLSVVFVIPFLAAVFFMALLVLGLAANASDESETDVGNGPPDGDE